MTDLFGEEIVLVRPSTKRRIKDMAHPAMPGTGPDGQTCNSCQHKYRNIMPSGRKAFYKCKLMRHAWTGGYGTDIKLRDKACMKWTPI